MLGLALELDKANSLKFKTRENFKTDATEFYNISYQYENDCLRAAIEYNKSFYSDNDFRTRGKSNVYFNNYTFWQNNHTHYHG